MTDYAEEYISEHEQKDVSFESILSEVRREQVLESLSQFEYEGILEVGCGFDPVFASLSELPDGDYTVVEPEKDFIRTVRSTNDTGGVTFINAPLEDAVDELSTYDFIIVSSVLHEVPDPDQFLDAIHAVCHSNSTVHINVPNVYSFHRLLAYEMGLIDDVFVKSDMEEKFDRHTRYDMEKLQESVEEHGFSVLDSGTYLIKPFTVDQMEEIIEEGIVDESIIEGLKGMTEYLPDMGCEMYVDVSPET